MDLDIAFQKFKSEPTDENKSNLCEAISEYANVFSSCPDLRLFTLKIEQIHQLKEISELFGVLGYKIANRKNSKIPNWKILKDSTSVGGLYYVNGVWSIDGKISEEYEGDAFECMLADNDII